MRILDCYPEKGTFSPGEPVQINVQVTTEKTCNAELHLEVWHLDELGPCIRELITLRDGVHQIDLEFELPSVAPCGYGVRVRLMDGSGQIVDTGTTTFDVLSSWTERPRYGFLADFGAGRTDIVECIRALLRHHINGLQFYDWQYRHDQLLPVTQDYLDPLGRKSSLRTVEAFIAEAHQHGIAAMPYMAVYAASIEFWRDHLDWALYDAGGKPLDFEGFLGIMDPSPLSSWIDHLLDQCDQLLAKTDFDGLHVDQYGEPKTGFNARGDEVNIASAFNYFAWLLKKRFKEEAITFNAVGNWPIDHLASAPLDFLYVEVWPDTPKYADLLQIIRGGREKSHGRPIVIALYLPIERTSSILLADAVIMASGGSRIELGENERLLTDPYFPKHQSVPTDFLRILRRYHDFQVQYGDLIGPQAADQDGGDCPTWIEAPEGVWAIPRFSPGWLAVNLVNFAGLVDPRWDEPHPTPYPRDECRLRIRYAGVVSEVWFASPDREDYGLLPAIWHCKADTLEIVVPYLSYWSLVGIRVQPATQAGRDGRSHIQR